MSKVSYRYGSMNSGKSTLLLQAANNYEEMGMKVSLWTAEIDDRAGVGVIGSRLGVSRSANTFGPDDVFDETSLGKPNCVLVDEAQFLTDAQVRQLHKFAHLSHVPVICYGLRTDFQGRPFEGSVALLALADDMQEIRTICSCGRRATMVVRIDEAGKVVKEGKQVEIGGNSRYKAVCGRCFYAS